MHPLLDSWMSRHDQVVLRREALELGVSDDVLRHHVRTGQLLRVRQGVYVRASLWERSYADARHRMLTAGVRRTYGDDVALSHVSAAVALGAPTWGLDLSDVHLTHLRAMSGRRMARVSHHRGRCGAGDLSRDEHGWVTTPERTLVDVARHVSVEAGVVLADWMLHEGLTTKDHLRRALDQQGACPGALHVRTVVAFANGLSESVGESRCRFCFWQQRLPRPVPQLAVHDRDGRFVARVDFAWPELGIVVEFDGRAKYEELRRPGETLLDVVRRERAREAAIVEATGWVVLRVTWDELRDPVRLAARIRRVMAARAGVPPSRGTAV